MGAARTDEGSAPGKGNLIGASILGAVLLIALIWSLSRALNNSSPHGAVVPTNAAATMNTALMQEEIERQHEMAEQRTAPVIQTPAVVPPAVIPANQNNDAVILQRERKKANKLIAERMKQYISENPTRDNSELEDQIKKREKPAAPIQ